MDDKGRRPAGTFGMEAELHPIAGLVAGKDRCLIVDSRESAAAAAKLVADIRAVTTTPWPVVDTHARFDHTFGHRPAFLPA